MGLKQRHRRLLLGLLVLGCFGLIYIIATRGVPKEDHVTIQAGLAARLTVAGATLEIPADALEPGTIMTLTTTPVDQSDFPREHFPDEVVLTEMITVASSTSQDATIPLQLSVELPHPPATFFARVKGKSADAVFEIAPDWNLALGDFEPSTRILRFELLGATIRDSLVVVTRKAGGVAPSSTFPPRKSSVQERAFSHRAVETLQVQINRVAGWVTGVAPWVVSTASALGRARVVDLATTAFVVVCHSSLTCDPDAVRLAAASMAVARKLVEARKFFAGPELALPKAILLTDTKAAVVRSGLVVYGFAGPVESLSLDGLKDSDRVVVVSIGGLPQEAANKDGAYVCAKTSGIEAGSILLNLSVLISILSNPFAPGPIRADYLLAHEVFHAVQNFYVPKLCGNPNGRWIQEATAQAASVAALTGDFTARRDYRFGDWRDWASPLGLVNNDMAAYQASEFFLEAEAGSLNYMAELFNCLALAGRIRDPLQSYAIMEACPSFDLEASYLKLISRRSTQNYPNEYRGSHTCVLGSTCTGNDDLSLAPMAAQYQQVALTGPLPGDKPQSGPREIAALQSVSWSLAFTVKAGNPSKYKMLIPSVSQRFIPPDSPVKLRTDKIDLWVVNHDSQATSPESTYSFVVGRDVEVRCQKTSVNKWSGEGTIHAEVDVSEGIITQKVHKRGVFTFTIVEKEVGGFDGNITGEGTATVTATGEFSKPAKVPIPITGPEPAERCTGSEQVTAPVRVRGSREGSALKLTFEIKLGRFPDKWEYSHEPVDIKNYRRHYFCKREASKWGEPASHYPSKLWFGLDDFYTSDPFKVTAEDGGTGQAAQDILFIDGKLYQRVFWSVRISRETGQSPSEIPPLH